MQIFLHPPHSSVLLIHDNTRRCDVESPAERHIIVATNHLPLDSLLIFGSVKQISWCRAIWNKKYIGNELDTSPHVHPVFPSVFFFCSE